MPYKDPDYQRNYQERYRVDNKEQIRIDGMKYRANNKEHRKLFDEKYNTDIKNVVINSIIACEITDQKKWNVFCNRIKSWTRKNMYSDNFTNDIIFEKLSKGCFYCGEAAITIDRIDSTLNHTPDNCVGCCWGCNFSKGAADPATFVRKAYYRSRGKYVDDVVNIWFEYKTKPRWDIYKNKANKQGVPFELTKEDWERLVKGDCEYCKRSPTMWFGVDRVIPGEGYIIDNVVSCCYDCNIDKYVNDVETTLKRNEQISGRVDNGGLVITDLMTSATTSVYIGIRKSSKKTCVYGKIYVNKTEASRTLGKNDHYVGNCIRRGSYPNDIFEITDEFYEKYKDRDNITLDMYKNFISASSHV